VKEMWEQLCRSCNSNKYGILFEEGELGGHFLETLKMWQDFMFMLTLRDLFGVV
jgi:hypothetical protein